MKQSARKPTQQQNGQEDSNKRHGDGNNGKRYFLTALKRRITRGEALFYVARDIFDDDNGVINHKAG